jgi:hypothetical protein
VAISQQNFERFVGSRSGAKKYSFQARKSDGGFSAEIGERQAVGRRNTGETPVVSPRTGLPNYAISHNGFMSPELLDPADGSGIGGAQAIGGARQPVWRIRVAGADGKAAIDPLCPQSAEQRTSGPLEKTPDH